MPKPPTKMRGSERRSNARKRTNDNYAVRAKKRRETKPEGLSRRSERLSTLLSWLKPVPEEWLEEDLLKRKVELTPQECDNYQTLIESWKKCLRWRPDLDVVLSIMLAQALSTDRRGSNQLWVRIIAPPGSGKTEFCDAFLVNRKYCIAVENLNGLTSGSKDDKEGKVDFSLIKRANNKLWITPEVDVFINHPNYRKNAADVRRAYDGQMTVSYKNMKEDRRYTALRIPWIQAGTPQMLTVDDAGLGDRFMKLIMEEPSMRESRRIVDQVMETEWEATAIASNGEAQKGKHSQEAYQLTAGYISWLREEGVELLSGVTATKEQLSMIGEMGYAVAYFRSRPSRNSEDIEAFVEQPTRVTGQLTRLTRCLCVVLNKKRVDEDVMRRVKRVAMSSCIGPLFAIAEAIYDSPHEYTTIKAIELKTEKSSEYTKNMLRFMRQIGLVQLNVDEAPRAGKGNRRNSKALWGLTPFGRDLYEKMTRYE